MSKDAEVEELLADIREESPEKRAEVDRYISWPAQALSYKLGEMKILELRQRAEEALGNRFDIKEFHDVLLGQGALPLDLLETVVDNYIETNS